MTTDQIRLRNEFINTQIITKSRGTRLGVVKEVLVDVDRREVVALGLKDNMLSVSGIPQYMYIESIAQIGDVILVDNEDVIEDINVDLFSKLINSEVITETGEPLGRVRDFQFNLENGQVSSLIIASIGLPQIPDQVISTYEIGIEEVVSSGPNRLIVFEGAEERITQVTVGLLERVGLGRPPWEKEQEDLYYTPAARPENQLGTGVPLRTPAPPAESRRPAVAPNWQEEAWEEETIAMPPPRRQQEAVRYQEYDDYEDGNWNDAAPPQSYQNVEGDMWDDEDNYGDRPRVNIPKQQVRQPEYEEEPGGY